MRSVLRRDSVHVSFDGTEHWSPVPERDLAMLTHALTLWIQSVVAYLQVAKHSDHLAVDDTE